MSLLQNYVYQVSQIRTNLFHNHDLYFYKTIAHELAKLRVDITMLYTQLKVKYRVAQK